MRSPDEILSDFDLFARLAHENKDTLRELLWEVIEDIQSTVSLAIRSFPGMTVEQISGIEATVMDYIANHYGDE